MSQAQPVLSSLQSKLQAAEQQHLDLSARLSRQGEQNHGTLQTLVKTLKLLGNCTDKSNYHRDEDLVKRCWIEIAKKLEDTAALYEIDFQVTLNGEPVAFIDTSEPLS